MGPFVHFVDVKCLLIYTSAILFVRLKWIDYIFQQKSVVNNLLHEAEAVKLKRDSCTQTRKFCRLLHQSGVELSWFHSE